MAATKLIAMHQNKDRSVMRCLKDRTDYAMNGDKTDEGKYISSYQCNPELVDLEFAQAKKEYLHKTWRQPKGDVIAYSRPASPSNREKSHRRKQTKSDMKQA